MTTVSAVHKFMYPWKCEFSKLRNIAVLLLSTAQHVLYQNEGRISCLQIYIESLALSDIHVSTAIQYVIASMKILIGILIVKHLYIISNPEPHSTSTCFWVRSLYLSALLCVVLHAVQTPRNSVFNEWQVNCCWFLAGQSLAVETASVTMEIRKKSGECPLILQMRGAYRFLNFGSYEICLLCLITTALLKKKIWRCTWHNFSVKIMT